MESMLNAHCHLSMCAERADVPSHLRVLNHGPGAYPSHPLDTVCCVKRFVSDSRMCQLPQVIIPFARMTELPSMPLGLRPLYNAGLALASNWLELALLLLEENPNAVQARSARLSAAYLLELVGPLPAELAPEMPFHASPPGQHELSLARLEATPKVARHMLPVAVFTCAIRR
jgi:hypothetical protein